MAQHVSVGKPANDAEIWAFDYLQKYLPDHYILITNVDVYTDSNQPFEVDAIVVGDWGVYVLDVKGYQGELFASKDIWKHNDRIVDNPLSKLNQNARVLASRCKSRIRQNQHAPWCQGLVFVTGGLGQDIEIFNGDYDLAVYSKERILDALTNPEFITARYKHKLERYQRELAVNAICDFKLLKEKDQRVSNYIKIRKLFTKKDFEVWLVKPEGHTFDYQYWMKFVDITSVQSDYAEKLRAQLKKEYYLLSELSDIPLVPAVLTYHDDGESIALVHQEILGQPLSTSPVQNSIEVFKSVLEALVNMQSKGILHRALSLESIYVNDGRVQLANVGYAYSPDINTLANASQLEVPWLPLEYLEKGIYTGKSLSYQFALTFMPLIAENPPSSASTLDFQTESFTPKLKKEFAGIQGLSDWVNAASNHDMDSRPELEELLSCCDEDSLPLVETSEIKAGSTIANKYRLEECIGRGGTSSIWRARHLIGDYDCCLKILDSFDGADELAKKEFEILRVLYHPNIVRIFDLDIVPGNDNYFLTCEYLDGSTLDQLESPTTETLLTYFEQILSALQYLHRMGRMHKDVKPENIMVVAEKAYLIDFNISLADSKLLGTTRFKDPLVKSNGWHSSADLYSLVLTFSEIITGVHPFVDNDEIPSLEANPGLSGRINDLPDSLRVKFEQTLRHEVNWSTIDDYLAWFKLTSKVNVDIPQKIINCWKIKKGYMSKVLTTMLGDMQPRSREVVKRNTLKAYGIVGNKSNKGSVNAAISMLKSGGIIEEHGKKIRLTSNFLSDWESVKGK